MKTANSSTKTAIVILAAGRGTRMRSDLPKVLHPLAGRPLINYVAETISGLGPDRVVVVVGPGMEAVASAVAPAQTVVQTRQLGTGHAVMAAREALAGFDGDVLVLYGDTPLIRLETLQALLAARRAAPAPALAVLGFRPDDPADYGRLKLAGDGALEAIVEARDATEEERAIPLCNAGVMAVDGARLIALLDGLDRDNAKGEYYLTDIVAAARARGLDCAVVEGAAEEVLGINSRSELAAAEAIVQRRLRAAAMAAGVTLIDPETVYFSHDTAIGRDCTVGPHVVFGPGVSVGTGVAIRAFSHIEGARIADGALVGPFARLRPGTEIGAQAHIGNFVEIKEAIVEAGAKVNHLAYIGDARVGAGANVGAGTITCNYDGFTKGFTDIGADAFIGSNTALVAPVKVGEGAIIGAGSVIARDVAADAVAVTRPEHDEREGAARRFRERRAGAKVQAETKSARNKATG